MENRIGLVSGRENRRIFTAKNMRFFDHIHRTYEIMLVERGEVTTVIDGKSYRLRQKECAVIFPLQHHSFSVSGESQVRIFLFSAEYVPEFTQKVQGFLPQNPVFEIHPPRLQPDDPLSCRAACYGLCAELYPWLTLIPSDRALHRCDAAEKLLLYIDEHYTEDCDLGTAAITLRYGYTYLSRQFRLATDCSFRDYLNRYRVSRACYLLVDGGAGISEIAAAVGYASQRTFNRAFLQVTGMTPSQYRRGKCLREGYCAGEKSVLY